MKTSRSTRTGAKRTRDPIRTKRDILAVATEEFGRHGFDGARVDRIAAKTRTSKLMLYYYYKSKKGLYASVLEESYRHERAAEADLRLAEREPEKAIEALTKSAVDFHFDNPIYVYLVMNENINRGTHIDRMNDILELNSQIIDRISEVLRRGQEAGVFRSDVDPVDVHLLITALAFFPISNRYTFSKIFQYDLFSEKARETRKREAVKAVLGYLRSD